MKDKSNENNILIEELMKKELIKCKDMHGNLDAILFLYWMSKDRNLLVASDSIFKVILVYGNEKKLTEKKIS